MKLLKTLTCTVAALAFAAPAWAEFPEKPINLVVGFRAGGGSDTAARILAAEMESALGQKIIVENRGGAGGAVATEYVRAQDPDGYTIGFAVATTFSFTPLTGSVGYTPDALSRRPMVIALYLLHRPMRRSTTGPACLKLPRNVAGLTMHRLSRSTARSCNTLEKRKRSQ